MTTDDILESLTRQAELRKRLGEKDAVRLEEIAETEELNRFQGFNPEPVTTPSIERNRSFAHLAFILMLLCGLTVVWLYRSVAKSFDIASLTGIVQKSGVQSIFANQAQLGTIALGAVAIALWIRHRRRSSGVQFVSA